MPHPSTAHGFDVPPRTAANERIEAPEPLGNRGSPTQPSSRPCAGPRIDRSAEMAHWQSVHSVQRFVTSTTCYTDFAAAYRCGLEQFLRDPFVPFARAEPGLASRWPTVRGASPLPWKVARFAAQLAWERARQLAFAQARHE